MRRLAILSLLLCVSCSAPPIVDFQVAAINAEEEEIPCVILLDDQVLLNDGTNQPVQTPAQVSVRFVEERHGRGELRHVKLGVRALSLDPQGNALGGVQDPEDSPYVEDSRYVDFFDAREQVFILRPNREVGG
jgi:hypothetical protein